MDPYSGFHSTDKTEVADHMRKNGRDPDEMVFIIGPDQSVERISRVIALDETRRRKRKAKHKAQKLARRRNRG